MTAARLLLAGRFAEAEAAADRADAVARRTEDITALVVGGHSASICCGCRDASAKR